MRRSNGGRAWVKTIVKVVCIRDEKDGRLGGTQPYGGSASINALEAKSLILGHWKLENPLHQCLDRALAGMSVHNRLRMNMHEGKPVGCRLMLKKIEPHDLFAWQNVLR